MPCYTPPPSRTEIEHMRLNNLLDEIFDVGSRRSLDEMTRRLCDWCGANDVTKQSLELQIWWRDHQRWDAKRKADEEARREQIEIATQALQKLTPRERKALGLK